MQKGSLLTMPPSAGADAARVCTSRRLPSAGLPNMVLVGLNPLLNSSSLRSKRDGVDRQLAALFAASLLYRETGDASKARSYFPLEKQYLVTRNGGLRQCQLLAWTEGYDDPTTLDIHLQSRSSSLPLFWMFPDESHY